MKTQGEKIDAVRKLFWDRKLSRLRAVAMLVDLKVPVKQAEETVANWAR